MAIFVPVSTEIPPFIFSCAELQPVGLLSPMALVHLLMHARWWGRLVQLGSVVAMSEDNIFVHSQHFFISATIVLAARAGVHHMHYHPRTLHT